ncbi:MAG: AAA family ATPase [Gemmataceae bacterium]|nr:AAA family ATPase [Gemmataceae bacterium]
MTLHVPELSLVVLVGPSGAGKSTFARAHFKPTEILSSDYFRGLLADDETDQSVSAGAFELLHLVAGKRLALGRLAVIDATNVRPEARKQLLDIARRHHVQAVAVVLDVHPDVCAARNQLRPDRQFSPHVVRRHADDLRRSVGRLTDEGFRRVWVLRGPAEVAAATVERAPLPVDKRADRGPFDIVGDVHGCLDELLALLMKLGYALTNTGDGWTASHPDGRKLVFVGDLCDRGPDTPGVLYLAMDAAARGAGYTVVGNHDDKLLRWLRGDRVKVAHGLQLSIDQLGAYPPEFRDRVRDWLGRLPSHLVLDGGKLVVAHAGLTEEMHGRVSGAVRSFALYGDTTGETDEYGLPVRRDWAARYRGRANVVYGHTPALRTEWVNRTLCLDTGCVFGGSLTALRYPEMELVSVPALKEYAESKRPLFGKADPTPGPTPPQGEGESEETPPPNPLPRGGRGDRKEEDEEAAESLSPPPAGEGTGVGSPVPALSPLSAAGRGLGGGVVSDAADLLDLADVTGKRVIETAVAGRVLIREANAAAALEVMTRFAADPRWLVYLPPAMAPVEASPLPDVLEHPAEAFAYFRREGVGRVVCEEKHMGSRAVVIVCRDEAAATRRFGVTGETGIVYTRTGRRFFDDPATEAEFLGVVREAVTAAGWWGRFGTDWVALDGELMPWSAKAQELLKRQYAAAGSAGRAALAEVNAALAGRTPPPNPLPATERGGKDRPHPPNPPPPRGEGGTEPSGSCLPPPPPAGEGAGGWGLPALRTRFAAKAEAVGRFVAAYRRYCWPVGGAGDLRFAPFFLLATEGATYFDRDHGWHMRTANELASGGREPPDMPDQGAHAPRSPGVMFATPYREVDLADKAQVAAATDWWRERTEAGGEGMVVKPSGPVTRNGKGLVVQPGLKVRGREYLRIIYGPDYLAPENLSRLKHRGVGAKRGLAAREFGLGVEGLTRFARGDGLRAVHECAFAVLALESEPVDPRL